MLGPAPDVRPALIYRLDSRCMTYSESTALECALEAYASPSWPCRVVRRRTQSRVAREP